MASGSNKTPVKNHMALVWCPKTNQSVPGNATATSNAYRCTKCGELHSK